MYNKSIVIIGSGVSGINAAKKLIDGGHPGDLITIIDQGKNPYERKSHEVMHGFAGCGLFSDAKFSYLHNTIGGQLSKYTGEKKADSLIKEAWDNIIQFHPDPEKVRFSYPNEEPEFIKPYFSLRLSPTYHIGTNYLVPLGKSWYDWLCNKGVKFIWGASVKFIDFNNCFVIYRTNIIKKPIKYDYLIYNTGKSGVNLTQKLIDYHKLPVEKSSVQLGVRFESPQKYFQRIIDISYDFKLYKKINENVSIRTFCVNSYSSYIAEETTYGMKSYNGHSVKDDSLLTNMVNFGIIMEIKNIDNPFEFQLDVVEKCQIKNKGLYYSPGKRCPSNTSKNQKINIEVTENNNIFKSAYGDYYKYIEEFIYELNKVFNFKDDYGMYIPEVKYLTNEVKTNHNDLSLTNYPNVFFSGDSLSSRGIAVSSAQAIYASEGLLNKITK
jgi:uncharacterized FAD-dependent dehydrogenase